MKVDLPQPEGPMIAVTPLGGDGQVDALQHQRVAEPRPEILDVDAVSHGHLSAPAGGRA